MYVVEHALLNIVKNKGRNILLGAIIFAIITATVVALAIFNTTGLVIEETRAALQCAVRIAPQRQTVGGAGAMTPGGAGAGQVTSGAGGAVTQGGAGSATSGSTGADQASGLSIEQYRAFAQSEYLDGSDIKESARSPGGVDAVYYLKRPEMLAAFESELRNKGLPVDYNVRTDESAFDSVAGPVESLNSLALTFLIIVLVLGAVIMALMSVIAIRERKYEIGVLRAIGMKKKKVALGLWIEVVAITCVCFALGLGIGTALSQPVSDAIMTGQAQSTDTGSTSLADRLSGDEPRQAEKISVSVDAVTALEIFAIAVLLASITGVVSVSRITKSEPIKILMQRN